MGGGVLPSPKWHDGRLRCLCMQATVDDPCMSAPNALSAVKGGTGGFVWRSTCGVVDRWVQSSSTLSCPLHPR
jgi:hypothetical protein